MVKIIITFLSMLLWLSAPVMASSSNIDKLIKLENAINQNPYPIYLQLGQIRKSLNVDNNEELLWFFVRKAQAEFLLKNNEAFELTVSEAKGLLTNETPIEIKARLSLYSGVLARNLGKYEQAIKDLNYVLELTRDKNLLEIYVTARSELAYTSSLVEQFESSLIDLHHAYIDAQAANNEFLMAMVDESYGALYGYMFEFEKSVDYYTNALTVYRKLNYKPYIAEAIYGLASTYRYWKKYDQAIAYFLEYNQVLDFTPEKTINFLGLYGLGMSYAEQGSCDKAIEIIDKAIKTTDAIPDYVAELLKRKAVCEAKFGQFSAAADSLEKARAILTAMPELKDTTWTIELDKVAAELAEIEGRYQDAIADYKRYYDALMKFIENTSSGRVEALKFEMENERQRGDIKLLKEQARVQQLTVDRQQQLNQYQQYLIALAVIIIILVVYFFAQLRRRHRELVAAAKVDVLANCYNRKHTFNELDRFIHSIAEDKDDLSIILMDIDNFKQINDQYGHPAGDAVIKHIATVSKSVLRQGDIVGRIGGEEYLCVLNRISVERCLEVANRLLHEIGDHDFVVGKDKVIKVTVSMGIANFTSDIKSGQNLYVRADKALYHSKQTGKNRITLYRDITD